MRAFRVTIAGLSAITFAASAAQAKWFCVRSYRDAGYGRHDVWPDCAVKRAPEYDQSPLRDQPGKCWGEDYVSGKEAA